MLDKELEPRALWQYFAELNAVPRASKRETRVTEFMRAWGTARGLATEVDAVGNVLIRKPAQGGGASALPVVLQAHLDMVHQQNSGTNFDFENQGIRMRQEGDWIRAEGTTLGADNGIGVAAIMAVLASNDLIHPELEALFTIDEETGMTGAKALQGNWLRGRVLLNLDTEDDTELTIGCAGGVDVTGRVSYRREPVPGGFRGGEIRVRGLTGGHSGMDIHLGRANANKVLARLLGPLSERGWLRVAELTGGSLRNAIPREARALVAVPESRLDQVAEWVQQTSEVIQAEYRVTDPGLQIFWERRDTPVDVAVLEDQLGLLQVTDAIPNGIFRMSPTVAGLVQTSNNLAKLTIHDGLAEWACLTRSSVNSERDELARVIRSAMQLAGAEVTFAGDYPGWEPAPESRILEVMRSVYHQLFAGEPHVAACHAGLECGIIGAHYPGMEMISFGPNIRGAHSPDEQVQISSVQKFWRFLTRTLEVVSAARP